ncbi:MAG: SGNH/GDSL hydrolase family protein [Anaerolineae bacterium]|nr:SGNH/GDSL hydrolase family protein [Anaerolineae bacterium]MDW8173936.1 SGNH/GDSL hydrolase family protein [Anaerolineae bacterium]
MGMGMEMDEKAQSAPEQALARDAFGLALLGLLAHVPTTLALATVPTSPSTTFALLQNLSLLAFALLTLANSVLCVAALRLPSERLARALRPIARLLRPGLSAALLLLALAVNLLALVALPDIAPLIVAPLRFWWAMLTVILALASFSLHRQRLADWWSSTQPTWAILGLSTWTVLAFMLLALLSHIAVRASGLNDRLRGALDYRPLSFVGEDAPSPQAFWIEQSQTRVRWLPYSYWVVDAFQGQHIRVSAEGLRHTVQPANADPQARPLAFFGGSTMWGEGARDPYTIPSQVAALLSEAGRPLPVINYGQTGYVLMQDCLLFQAQLLQGRAPRLAVFYGGFNDLLAAYGSGAVGVTMQESERLSDSEAGRLLRGGQPLLRPLHLPLDTFNLSLVAQTNSSAEAIVERWWAITELLRALCAAYEVRCLFVWQPSIAFKQRLSDYEQAVVERMDADMPGFRQRYLEADALLRARYGRADDLLILSNLFADTADSIFFDLIHITEQGNLAVAQALLPRLLALLSTS